MELSTTTIAYNIASAEPKLSAIEIIVKAMEAVENFSSMDGTEKTSRVVDIVGMVADKLMSESTDILRNNEFIVSSIKIISQATKGNIAVNIRDITKAYAATIATDIIQREPTPKPVEMIALAMQEVEKMGGMTGEEKRSYVVSIALTIAHKQGYSDSSILRDPYVISQVIDTIVKTSKGKFILNVREKINNVFMSCFTKKGLKK